MRIGIAAEGITDQAVLENICCGYFENEDLDQDLYPVQPMLDDTDNCMTQGGWPQLFFYLKSTRFRDDVNSYDYLIIQVDTDVASREEFGIPTLQGNQTQTQAFIINEVRNKLINEINSGHQDFYQDNADKIIFCIAVHETECWIHPLYCEEQFCLIDDCFEELKESIKEKDEPLFTWTSLSKKRDRYLDISEPFLDKEKILSVKDLHLSFSIFLNELDKVQF